MIEHKKYLGSQILNWKLDATCPRCLVKIQTGRWPLED